MELRKLTVADMQQVLHVWKTCFNDSDDFLEAYFQSSMDIKDGLGFFSGSRLVSDLFMREVPALVSGTVYTAGFLAGCATMPDARNQHLMRDLIHETLLDLRDRQVCALYLHPFLHSFYRKFGFATVSYVRTLAASGTGASPAVQITASFDQILADSLYASYEAYVSQYGSSFMRSADRMNAWLQLLFRDGGKAAYINGTASTPYALYYETQDQDGSPVADVFELVYFNDGDLLKLTQGLGMNARYFLPAHAAEKNVDEFTMMRVVCPDIMLQNYSFADGVPPFVINIHDAFLNTDSNLLVTPNGHGAKTTEVRTAADLVVDIAELARLLCGAFDPHILSTAARYFRTGSSCYFETY